MREKKGGALQKLKKRLSHSFGRLTISREDGEDSNHHQHQINHYNHSSSSKRIWKQSWHQHRSGHSNEVPFNGYNSEEYLDRLEPNGNIPANKSDLGYGKQIEVFPPTANDIKNVEQRDETNDEQNNHLPPNAEQANKPEDWSGANDHERVQRQLSVSSDSKLLDEDIREETRVIMRPKKPPRPKSEVFLNKQDLHPRRKRFSAFGGDSPFGKTEAYIKLEQLGEGSYATVFKGYSNLTNQVVALKEIRLQEEEGAPFTAIREASLLKELKHSNIVTLHDIVHTRETLTFVFEYVNTDLSQYMERHAGGLDHRNVRLFLFQLLRGLSYCHKRRVLHRDVKPQNLLISEIGELKLADFGLARAKSVPSHTYSHEVVTLWYRPPDVLLGSTDYSTSLDMWGVGCIFVEMITGMPTFPGIRDTYDQLDKIFKLLGTPTEDTWRGVTHLPGYKPQKLGFYRPRKLGHSFPRLYDIVEGEAIATLFLQLNPEERMGAEDALNHPYFAPLPRKLFELPDETSIFTVEGVYVYPEPNRQNK
ncbi:cyclin-dependent kinase 14 isoform X4 [Sitodiplosis mosellana]|nr:cyclin-dependent kinase 14 isoform X4 [Sitodiplosis mosellana]XP_055323898.1 cyclin-dependent kinase 14 isoform X4 [Sitodiplosis mosellana]XP_055323899.1 cyclin-dependent kinase 14 isoform X4 [Sitodiplosis mosellana]XP_055323900.1 cyclin-dependent kinase 14 isoform X4 [Sitodiplosis mosellana]XP_055323902.1 cyclin-dependent kinase 14 isoform X4 [Sitodiplosis mosellana]